MLHNVISVILCLMDSWNVYLEQMQLMQEQAQTRVKWHAFLYVAMFSKG